MIGNILVFHGENEYEIENNIKKNQLDYEIKEIDDSTDFIDLINLLNTPALFNDLSLYVMRNENVLNDDKNLSLLEEYLNNPSPFARAIIAVNKKVDSRKKAVKFFKSKGLLFEFSFKKGRELQKWIKEYIWSKGYAVDDEGMEYLIEVVGDKQDMLKSEIDKVTLFDPMDKKISIDILKVILSNNVQSNIFNLLDSIFRDKDKMIASLDNLIKSKESVPLIIFMLIKELRTLARAKWFLKEKYSEDKIISLLEVHPFYGKKKISLAKKITFADLFKYLKNFYSLEEKVKSGKGESTLFLKSTLLGIK